MANCFVLSLRHPMYPLLVLLLEKCEIATKSADSQPSANLNEELKAFLQRLQREKPSLFSEDKETNELVTYFRNH